MNRIAWPFDSMYHPVTFVITLALVWSSRAQQLVDIVRTAKVVGGFIEFDVFLTVANLMGPV